MAGRLIDMRFVGSDRENDEKIIKLIELNLRIAGQLDENSDIILHSEIFKYRLQSELEKWLQKCKY